MLTLTLRTDKPEAETGLYQGDQQLAHCQWLAHRQLAETIHQKIAQLLKEQNLDLKDLTGLAIYKGPGSFTGLRIGFSVANALAAGLNIPIIANGGDNWIEQSLTQLSNDQNENMVLPEYGSPPHITKPKH